MTPTQQQSILSAANCEVRFDNLTRQLYATDASHYQVEPVAVAFPRGAKQASSILRAAADAGVAIIPRGAGTGLIGGCLGDGVVVDFSRHNRGIADFNKENRSVRVGAGVVLDQLNDFLRPHGLCFGPDVATSSRATIGGMIANNSSGAHCPYYGTTTDHLIELEIVMADGSVVKTGPRRDTLEKQRELIENLAFLHKLEITERRPPGLVKRWPAYAVERCLQAPININHILCGSEGTLAAITAAELRLSPLPKERGLALLFFASVADAMQATVELLDLQPAAIEHVDRPLLDQTIGKVKFQAARDMMDLDARPAEAILAVEFFEDVEARLAAVAAKRLTRRGLLLRDPAQMALFWQVRKAGLSLLTGMAGDAKPATVIEDAAVVPAKLPAYVAGLQKILGRHGLTASFYGHAASGLLHVRPVVDLHTPAGVKVFRQLATEVAALVKEFKGSLAAEHGVGMAHTEFMADQLGEALLGVMREIKKSFDPYNLLNPGKIIPDGRFEIDENLRLARRHELKLPFEPVLAFRAKDKAFLKNLEQCNGCGGCLKWTPTMCPTYVATGEEGMSTRGRANLIRAVLEQRGTATGDPLRAAELEYALSNCLSCKACGTECPSNVNLPLLKAELQHARIRRDGLTLKERAFSHVEFLGRLGCLLPGVSNWAMEFSVTRSLLHRLLGLAPERHLPRYTHHRFDRWFAARPRPATVARRGRVILWDDTYIRYYDPEIGIAAVQVLEAAGYEVTVLAGRQCCGRPAFSQGNLDYVRRLATHNVGLLNAQVDQAPIVFLEPSCWSMFAEDYAELKIPNAERVAGRAFLFEQFLDELLAAEPGALTFNQRAGHVAIHAHCHAKSMTATDYMERLARRLPNRSVRMLETGCCGMAGGFGMLAAKYELSIKVAEPLIEQIKAMPFNTTVVASGTSCRHQISHLATVRLRHMAELLAESLALPASAEK
ncbi:MAG: FAD-binding and (Fe-S)-binding domain-containing protein [Limisphaerales bacterium]